MDIMAHMEKYTRSSAGQLCQHYERKKLPDGSYVKFGNQDIDLTKTHLNYNLAPQRSLKGQIEYINQRCSEVKCLNRKDVNVMCSWAVTLPKEFPPERSEEFFKQTYEFLNNRYGGEKNVISAYVHLDETTPHIHYAFVPVVRDKKTGKEKVSAKEVITKKELLIFHNDLKKHLYKYFGFEVAILNGATEKGNLSIQELKLKTSVENLAEKEKKLQHSVRHYEELQVAVKEVDNIGTKSLVGKNMVVPPDELALLKEQAKAFCANKDAIEGIREEQRRLREEERRIKETAEKQYLQLEEKKKQADEIRKQADNWYNQASKLFDEVTLGKLSPQTYDEMKAYIERLETELKYIKSENTQIKAHLQNSVPNGKYSELLKLYNECVGKFQSLERDYLSEKENIAEITTKNVHLKADLIEKTNAISKLKELNKQSNTGFTDVICALGSIENKENSVFIKAVRACAVKWLKEDGYAALAEKAEKEVSISDTIRDSIKKHTPELSGAPSHRVKR